MQEKPSTSPAIPFTIGVTGHRNLSRVEEDRIRPFLDEFLVSHAHKHPDLPIRLLSGLAEGADRIVARVFIEVRARLISEGHTSASEWQLIATLPFAEEAYRNDFPETGAEFSELLDAADDVVTITRQPLGDLQSNPVKRDDGYEAQGHYMLRHAHLIIALWDGVDAGLRGGTSHVVRLKLKGHENPDNAFAAQDCGPVYHIPVQRGDAVSPHKAGSVSLLFPATSGSGPGDLEALKSDLGRFNAAHAKIVRPEAVAGSLRYLSPPGEAGAIIHEHWLERASSPDRLVMDVFANADLAASTLDRKRVKLTRLLYLAGMALALALWIGLDKVAQGWMVAVYLGALAAIFALYTRLKRHDLSTDQLNYRLLAEALRVQIYWRMLDEGDTDPADLADGEMLHAMVLDGLLSQQAAEMGWIREALRICGTDRKPTRLARDHRARLIHHWIEDQYNYFVNTEHRYERQHVLLGRAAAMAAVCGIISAGCVIWINQHDLSEALRHWASISAASLPAAALLLESYKDRMALEEQAKNMARMRAVFGRMKSRLKDTPPHNMPPANLIRMLGQEALAECVGWLILRRSKPTALPT